MASFAEWQKKSQLLGKGCSTIHPLTWHLERIYTPRSMLNLSSIRSSGKPSRLRRPSPNPGGRGDRQTRVITPDCLLDWYGTSEHILGVTFTNKAARERAVQRLVLNLRGPWSRANPELGPNASHSQPQPSTLNPSSAPFTLCVRILASTLKKGYKRNFVITMNQAARAIKKILAQISARAKTVWRPSCRRFRNGGERARCTEEASRNGGHIQSL
jgi:hypothetical protein